MAFGRLEKTKGSQPISDINVTPLVDVMLVLVVIFIITAPLLASSIKLDLPQSEAAKQDEPPAAVTVVIDNAGQIYIEDKPLTPQELVTKMHEAAKANAQTEIQLKADKTVNYGKIVEVMTAAQNAGLNRIGFVAENNQAK